MGAPSLSGARAGAPTSTPSGSEPGQHTTEFWLTVLTPFVTALLALLLSFGVHLTQEQQAAIVGLVVASVPLVVTAYTLGRSLRKGLNPATSGSGVSSEATRLPTPSQGPQPTPTAGPPSSPPPAAPAVGPPPG